mgnify:CR=1 FL=1
MNTNTTTSQDEIIKFLDLEMTLGISDKRTIERVRWYYETYFKSKISVTVPLSDEDIYKMAEAEVITLKKMLDGLGEDDRRNFSAIIGFCKRFWIAGYKASTASTLPEQGAGRWVKAAERLPILNAPRSLLNVRIREWDTHTEIKSSKIERFFSDAIELKSDKIMGIVKTFDNIEWLEEPQQ